MLKQVGTAARMQIERMMGTKVFLELFVKVKPNWRESRGFVEELDWRRQLVHLAGGQIELPKALPSATYRPKSKGEKTKQNIATVRRIRSSRVCFKTYFC